MAPKQYSLPGRSAAETEPIHLDIPGELTPGVAVPEAPGNDSLDLYGREQKVVQALGSNALPHWTERPDQSAPQGFDAFGPEHKPF